MKFRTIHTLALLACAASAPNAVAGVTISIGDAPPPPVIVVRQEPRMMFVPEARVYVVNDSRDDWFRVGNAWYIERDGWWYRANSYRGPYRVIERRYVPAVVWKVPKHHWKHYDSGHQKSYARSDDGHRKSGKSKGKGHK